MKGESLFQVQVRWLITNSPLNTHQTNPEYLYIKKIKLEYHLGEIPGGPMVKNHLLVQEMLVQSLVQEDSTCHKATELGSHH